MALFVQITLRGDLPCPALVAHGDVAVVAAEEDLAALRDDPAAGIDPGIDGRLASAGAHGLDLRDGIRQFHEAPGAGKEMGEEVCP